MDLLNLKKRNNIFFVFLFCLLSFLGGAINGFVGTGGGIIYVFMLSFLTNNDKRDNFATSLFSMIFISLVGISAYFRAGSVDFNQISGDILPSILGGLLCAILTSKLKIRWLNLLFGILVIYSGVKMIL